MNTTLEIHVISLRSARMQTKYSSFFVAIALLAVVLQGCEQGTTFGKASSTQKLVKGGRVCTVRQHLQHVEINGRSRKFSEFKDEGCVLKFDANGPTFSDRLRPKPPTNIGQVQDISRDFPSDLWSEGDVLRWGAASGVRQGSNRVIVQGRVKPTENGAVVVDCTIKGLKIILGPVQTAVVDVFGARLTNAVDTCRKPTAVSIDNAFPADQPCTVQRALSGLKINGRNWKLSDFEQEDCLLKFKVARSCWNAGDGTTITFDKVSDCWYQDSEFLRWEQASDHELEPGDRGRSWVYLDCESKGMKVRLASYSTDVFQREGKAYKYKVRAPSTCHQPLAFENKLGFPASLIQQVETNSTNLLGGPNAHRTDGTEKVTRFSRPVHRMGVTNTVNRNRTRGATKGATRIVIRHLTKVAAKSVNRRLTKV